MTILTIPSPAEGVWHLGPFPIRAYALCIIVGVIAAIWIGEKRWVARGGKPGQMSDIALWAIPFGLVGARLYHVATDYHLYFGEGRDPITALYVWRGGLGIWGAIALGAVGAMVGAKVMGIKVLPMMDALAPGVIVAQAFGRFGNWFNQELYGKPTDLPWGLEIDRQHFSEEYVHSLTRAGKPIPDTAFFHPTFLYEALWCLAVFALLIWADRRFKLGFGRVVALYVMGYTVGRGWIETLRIDDVQMNDVFGLRLNVWTSIVLFLAALAYFVWSSRRHPGREESVLTRPQDDDPAEAKDTSDTSTDDDETDDADDSDADESDADDKSDEDADDAPESGDSTSEDSAEDKSESDTTK